MYMKNYSKYMQKKIISDAISRTALNVENHYIHAPNTGWTRMEGYK